MATVQQLSCQSSIEPCVPEEEIIDIAERETKAVIESTTNEPIMSMPRPDSLILNTATVEGGSTTAESKKYLYRSQSTRSFKKAKPSKLLSSDLDQIYVISSNSCTRDDFYDSIEVISERRNKNFMVEHNTSDNGTCDNGNTSSNNAAFNSKEETVANVES
jgi:hypothetical protein